MLFQCAFCVLAFLIISAKSDLPFPCEAPLTIPLPGSTFLTTHRLLGVHVVTRHGDRSPESPLPLFPVDWNCSDSYEMLGIRGVTTLFRKRFLPHAYDILTGSCSVGQLTSRGILQHYTLGQNLARKYRRDIPFLISPVRGDILIRSTNVDRTIQSAQMNLAGFFNGTEIGNDLYDLWIWPGAGDALLPPTIQAVCPAVQKLNTWGNPNIPSILQKYSALISEAHLIFNITPELFPMIALNDGTICRFCHNSTYPLPGTVSKEFVLNLYNFFSEILSTTYQVGTDLLSAPLIYELLGTQWLSAVKNQRKSLDGPKYCLWSAHDATLGFLLAGLNLTYFDGNFLMEPPFAAHLELELWQSSTDNSYVIGLSYNGQYLKIPSCNDYFCDYLEWYNSLNVLTPDQWTQKCTQ